MATPVMTADEFLARLTKVVEGLEAMVYATRPKSPKERAAELGLRVVEDGDDAV